MPRYDDPQFTNTKDINVLTSVTNAGSSKFALVNAAILKNARITVVVAGTGVGLLGVGMGVGGYSVVCGTLTAGVIGMGSDAAGVTLPAQSLGNFLAPAGTPVQLLHGTETTGVFNVAIEYSNAVV